MINGVGDKSLGRVDVKRGGVDRVAPAPKVGDGDPETASVEVPATPAAEMASLGAPVDTDKIAAIKSAIAEGRYPVNATLIAKAMLALGFDPAR
jgi:negative regulator of flagellin synthesis FlgM